MRLAAVAAALALLAGPAAAETRVVDADVVHTVSGPDVHLGRIVVRDGRIAAVGPALEVPLPEGARQLRAAAATPGLIDAQTSVGLSGLYNVRADQDNDDRSDPNQAELRALDAFHPGEPLLRHLLEHGVTLLQAAPGPSSPVAGQAGIFRTHGSVADEMAVKSISALVFDLGEPPKEAFGAENKLPVTRMGTASVIRKALLSGREYAATRARKSNGDGEEKAPERDLEREVLARVAAGELPAIFVAQRADDLATAVRIAREFNLRYALAGASEGWLALDLLREAGVPVLVGPVLQRPTDPETLNASLENAAQLERAGIRIAIRSGHEGYVPKARLVLFEAAVAAANGLAPDAALRAVTLGSAEILGVDDRYGSLEPGKVGDVVLFDGDPFEYTSHVTAVVVDGEVVFER